MNQGSIITSWDLAQNTYSLPFVQCSRRDITNSFMCICAYACSDRNKFTELSGEAYEERNGGCSLHVLRDCVLHEANTHWAIDMLTRSYA